MRKRNVKGMRKMSEEMGKIRKRNVACRYKIVKFKKY